jgi:hypothetical protein
MLIRPSLQMVIRPELVVELFLVLRDQLGQGVVERGAWRLGEFISDFGFRVSCVPEGAGFVTALRGFCAPWRRARRVDVSRCLFKYSLQYGGLFLGLVQSRVTRR